MMISSCIYPNLWELHNQEQMNKIYSHSLVQYLQEVQQKVQHISNPLKNDL